MMKVLEAFSTKGIPNNNFSREVVQKVNKIINSIDVGLIKQRDDLTLIYHVGDFSSSVWEYDLKETKMYMFSGDVDKLEVIDNKHGLLILTQHIKQPVKIEVDEDNIYVNEVSGFDSFPWKYIKGYTKEIYSKVIRGNKPIYLNKVNLTGKKRYDVIVTGEIMKFERGLK